MLVEACGDFVGKRLFWALGGVSIRARCARVKMGHFDKNVIITKFGFTYEKCLSAPFATKDAVLVQTTRG